MPFTNVPWDSPKSRLEAADYCKVCAVDLNEPGEDKIKAKCHLPLRSRPGAPYNKNAIRNAMARLSQTQIPAAARRRAARRLVRLAREAGIGVGPATLRIAGMR